jgi:hypothetical protein
MKPYQHQVDISSQALDILRKHMIVYLAMQERTGKTLTSILICEQTKCNNILVITKKKALVGWIDTLSKYTHNKTYECINYESLHKCTFKPDLVIIDEAHSNLGAYPKVGKTWKEVYKFTKGKPIIYLSATPSAQTYAQLYHQFKLSSWTPWIKYPSFYNWHKYYGIENIIYLGGRQIKQYNEVKSEKVMRDVEPLFISYTRTELGFEHEPNDILHYIDLSSEVREYYNKLLKDRVAIVVGTEVIADTVMALRTKLHQLEGSTLKQDDKNIFLSKIDKIDYILKTWGDSDNLVIFYQYQNELSLLKQTFKSATILQGTSFAEGVDLSMYETCVVYSMDFSTAKYTQRRARQCNMKRDTPIDFHFLLVKGAISEQVYKTVAVNRTNFVDSYFNKQEI